MAHVTAALLLSGGMDSIALAWWLRPTYAFTIDYGQRAAAGEIRAAAAVANDLGISHEVLRCDVSALGSGDMAGCAPDSSAPVREWWPFRNQLLVTVAGMRAIPLKVERLLIGALATDGLHADGTAAFVDALDRLLVLQEGGIRLEAPAIALDGPGLVRTSGVPAELLAWSHSCHVSDYACGECRGCRKHYDTTSALGQVPY